MKTNENVHPVFQDILERISKPKIENFGYANSWKDCPVIVSACGKARHKVESVNRGRCLTEVTCHECGYRYMVDSSD